MAFDLALIKEHPYATGAVVIVGGLIVFYMLSSSSGSSAASGGSNQSAILAADTKLAEVQSGTAQVNAQQAAAVTQAQIAAQEQQQQTAASVDINNTQTAAQLAEQLYGTQAQLQGLEVSTAGQTAQQANQYLFEQNTTAMQDAVLTDQINSGIVENANNNATAVAGAQITANTTNNAVNQGTAVAMQTNHLNYELQQQNDAAYNAEIPYIVQNAGTPQNSGLDATDQTGIFQTVLAKGAPGVASTGTGASSSVAANGNNTGAQKFGIVANGVSSGVSSIASGFFG